MDRHTAIKDELLSVPHEELANVMAVVAAVAFVCRCVHGSNDMLRVHGLHTDLPCQATPLVVELDGKLGEANAVHMQLSQPSSAISQLQSQLQAELSTRPRNTLQAHRYYIIPATCAHEMLSLHLHTFCWDS